VVKAAGKAWKEVQAEVAAGDALTGKVDASFKTYLAKARRWARWSDYAVLRAREDGLA
jgi:TRAP-type mannitol/chloroaromatic compound transport system substrate-binding protein